ncbi:hypothetical protein BV898_00913 [Hypsibius exemplaris]|uniref:IRG-type G domain-containing protein n=1 Tax=Hypsibius exemplaris TaxID=2072580 RepID=A0A1W0XCK1_HYPEX|nr:hypothetical protein BV898_00913 [Hypsibius exemplaris]
MNPNMDGPGYAEAMARVPEEDVRGYAAAYENLGVEGCRQYMEEKETAWKKVPLNIGIIGSSGTGKSSFINSMRRLTADDPGGAPVGVVECTTDIVAYAHPA